MGETSARSWRLPLALATVLVAAPGCSPAPDPSASTVAAAPSPVFSDSITIQEFEVPRLSNANWARTRMPGFVHSALLRFAPDYAPVPDLAERCDISGDHLDVTCTLRAASFHDGTPVTPDDVVFSYAVASSESCSFAVPACIADMLASAEAAGPDRVIFHLAHPDVRFMTLILATVLITPRHVIEPQFEHIRATADTARVKSSDLEALSGGLRTVAEANKVDRCASLLDEADDALRGAGVEPWPRENDVDSPTGQFDACSRALNDADELGQLAASLGLTGVDAIAAAYLSLPFNRTPVGAGPYRFASAVPGREVVLEAFPDYHLGAPVTREIRFVVLSNEAAVAAFRDGSVDWLPGLNDLAPSELAKDPRARVISLPTLRYTSMEYNVRPGRPFADRRLRQAMQACIDKDATVDASTDRRASAIDSPIIPTHWAFARDLPKIERDVARGRRLIEESGWRVGAGGVYAKAGSRLEFDVVYPDETAERAEFAELVARQARDCGMRVHTMALPFGKAIDAFVRGAAEAAVFQRDMFADPDLSEHFHSSYIPSDADPDRCCNWGGYASARADDLLDAGVATFDQQQRTSIYHDLQLLLAQDQPRLFAWSDPLMQVLRATLISTAGPLEVSSPGAPGAWQAHTLALPADDE